MLAVLAFFSDIPLYLLTLIGQLTGQDMTEEIDAVNKLFRSLAEKFE